MKKGLSILLALLMLGSIATAEFGEPVQCDHRYTLFLRADGLGYYTCFCTVAGCNQMFPVYPTGFDVEQPAPDAECPHIFRKADQSTRISIEATGTMHHEAAMWYVCTCERCGENFEAFETDQNRFEHVYTEWEHVHIAEEEKHVYISHCDACGYLECLLSDCGLFPNGYCMDMMDYLR